MKTIMFLGMAHRPNDPRLCHRQMRCLAAAYDQIKFIFVKRPDVCGTDETASSQTAICSFDGIQMVLCETIIPFDRGKWFGKYGRLSYRRHLKRRLIELIEQHQPDVIQASDVREIPYAVHCSKITNIPIIYDSHEDYFRQVLDFQGVALTSLLHAWRVMLLEICYLKYFKIVFCTDEFLLRKYRNPLYRQNSVYLLRNFPYQPNEAPLIPNEWNCELKLIYIGGVNKHRGVVECASFCQRFNSENKKRKLTFTVIGPHDPIIDPFLEQDFFTFSAWIDHADVMRKLAEYDVGICLWQDIPKFHRNLPLKNFDYMAAGLPILTSNFGNLKTYIDQAHSGLTIDPSSYDEFEAAVSLLFDPKLRRELSNNGISWVQQYGNFVTESKQYRMTMIGS